MTRWCPLILLAGCGSLVGGDYRGDVLMEIEGTVYVESDVSLDADVGVAVLWTNDGRPNLGAQSVLVDTSFPARYRIRLYKPPEDASILSLLGNQDLRASIGQIVLFEDMDGDGRWEPGREPVVGGAFDSAIVWVEDPDAVRVVLADGATSAPPYDPDQPVDPGYPEPVWAGATWSPRPGFQLVDVPIPPACGLPLDDILFERSDNRAALHVGALRNAYYDWDCDGIGDYIGLDDRNESGGGEDIPPQAPDLWVGECGPPEYLESDCLFIDEMLRDPAMFGFEDVTGDGTIADEMFPPEWLDCLYEVCPDLVDALRTPNPIPMAP